MIRPGAPACGPQPIRVDGLDVEFYATVRRCRVIAEFDLGGCELDAGDHDRVLEAKQVMTRCGL